jgi:DNA-binding NarL/FixJ family response regulator
LTGYDILYDAGTFFLPFERRATGVKGYWKMKKIRVFLASNYELWWEGLSLLLEKEEDMETLALCYDASTVMQKANELKPDIILLDEEIAGCDCGVLVQNITELQPQIKVIVVIKPYKNAVLSSSLKAKAKGYIDKDITFKELSNSIRQVAKGGLVIISPRVAQEFIEHISSYERYKANIQMDIETGLSKREKEVLALLAMRSITNREIAEKLYITESTVKAHLSNILEKMKVHTRQEAALIARENLKCIEIPHEPNQELNNKPGMIIQK